MIRPMLQSKLRVNSSLVRWRRGQAEVVVVKGWLALAQDRALDGAAPVWEAAAVLMDRSALMVVFDLPSSGVGSGRKEDLT